MINDIDLIDFDNFDNFDNIFEIDLEIINQINLNLTSDVITSQIPPIIPDLMPNINYNNKNTIKKYKAYTKSRQLSINKASRKSREKKKQRHELMKSHIITLHNIIINNNISNEELNLEISKFDYTILK